MSFRLALSYSMTQSVASLVLGFVSVKITSVFLGPVGVGIMGQMQMLINLLQGPLAGGLRNAVTKRTAELADDPVGRARVVGTVQRAIGAISVVVVAPLLLFSGWLAVNVLENYGYVATVWLVGATYALGLSATLIQVCANGARDYRASTTINIGQAVAHVALFALLCPILGTLGGLITVALMPAVNWLVAVAVRRRKSWWPVNAWQLPFSSAEARVAAGFLPVAAITGVGTPLIQLILRDQVGQQSGLAAIGWLQGVTRLSDVFINLFTAVGGMYLLPRFAQINVGVQLRRELVRSLVIVVTAVALFGLSTFLLRDLIIQTLFTTEFLPMRDLFGWQMGGCVLKMAGWVLAYVAISKVNPIKLMGLELFTQLLYWSISTYLIAAYGVLGAVQGFALSSGLYAVIVAVVATRVIRGMPRKDSGADTLQRRS